MKAILCAGLLLCAFPALAFAGPAVHEPRTPPAHAVTLTDQDLNIISMAFARAGEHCSPQDETACQLQLAADGLIRRLQAQMAPPPAKK